MNLKLTLSILLCAGAVVVTPISAQAPPTDEKPTEVKNDPPPLSISGQVDAYYRYSSAKVGGLTSYTGAHNAFSLGMANIVASKDMGKIGFVADLMFGPRAEETNYNYKTNSLAFLKQLYMTYKPTDKLKFTLGNFMTFVGYELVEASNNLNYSMAYNYTNGPFFHTGLKGEYALSDKLTAMVGVFQPTDFKAGVFAGGGDLNVGGQLAYVNGNFKIFFNALTGNTPTSDSTETKATVFDVTTSYQVTPKFGIGLNILDKMIKPFEDEKAVSDQTNFLGFAAYMNYAVSDKFILAARGEYFNDTEGVVYGLSPKITAFTLTGNVKIDALTIMPEIRFDSADQTIFGAKKSAVSYLLAAVYKF
jgi:hypothetical protein